MVSDVWLRMVMIVDGECVWGCGTVCGGCGWKDVGMVGTQ